MARRIKPDYKVEFDEQHEPIILFKPTMDRLLRTDNPGDGLALYAFYYYTAKWQKTNQPKATSGYCQTGLKWGRDKFRKAKRTLVDLGLIQEHTTAGKDGRITGHYIKINFASVQAAGFPPPGSSTPKSFDTGIENNIVTNEMKTWTARVKEFDEVWPHFPKGITDSGKPRSMSKGAARKAWVKACTSKTFKQCRPPDHKTAIAILNQMGRDVDPKYIPIPTTIINQGRWEDYPDLFKSNTHENLPGDWLLKNARALSFNLKLAYGISVPDEDLDTDLRKVWLHYGELNGRKPRSKKSFVRMWCDWVADEYGEPYTPNMTVWPSKARVARFLDWCGQELDT